MSNVRGNLVCEADGTGTVTAHVSGTGVAVRATVSLNGQDQRELGPGNHSYVLTGTFGNGEKVNLIVTREGGIKSIKVLTVDCPQPTTTTAPPTTVTPQIGTQTTMAPRESVPTLPATGGEVGGAFLAGGIILAGAFLITAARHRRGRA